MEPVDVSFKQLKKDLRQNIKRLGKRPGNDRAKVVAARLKRILKSIEKECESDRKVGGGMRFVVE